MTSNELNKKGVESWILQEWLRHSWFSHEFMFVFPCWGSDLSFWQITCGKDGDRVHVNSCTGLSICMPGEENLKTILQQNLHLLCANCSWLVNVFSSAHHIQTGHVQTTHAGSHGKSLRKSFPTVDLLISITDTLSRHFFNVSKRLKHERLCQGQEHGLD